MRELKLSSLQRRLAVMNPDCRPAGAACSESLEASTAVWSSNEGRCGLWSPRRLRSRKQVRENVEYEVPTKESADPRVTPVVLREELRPPSYRILQSEGASRSFYTKYVE